MMNNDKYALSRKRFARKAAKRREFHRSHTAQRIEERYRQNNVPAGLITETRNSIRKNRSVLIGHQNKCSVHAVQSSTGLVILMYDAKRKEVVTALPLLNPYLTALITHLNNRKNPLQEHEERILMQAEEALEKNPAPREWSTFTSINDQNRE